MYSKTGNVELSKKPKYKPHKTFSLSALAAILNRIYMYYTKLFKWTIDNILLCFIKIPSFFFFAIEKNSVFFFLETYEQLANWFRYYFTKTRIQKYRTGNRIVVRTRRRKTCGRVNKNYQTTSIGMSMERTHIKLYYSIEYTMTALTVVNGVFLIKYCFIYLIEVR